MHENASAGKFEAPPPPQVPDAPRSGARWLLVALLVASSYPVAHRLLPIRGRGWVTAVAAVVAFVLGILQIVLERRRADEMDGNHPYSPPTSLTR